MRIVYDNSINNIINDIFGFNIDHVDLRPLERKTSKQESLRKVYLMPNVKRVLFRDPATVVWFTDGTKSVAICGHGDTYDKETGIAICICKRMFGSQDYRKLMDKWCYTEGN